jgi:hypothetical protein
MLCVALHVAGMRTVQACVETIQTLLQTAGIAQSSLVATIIGGGTRVCGDETHDQVLAAFQEAKTALEQGLAQPATFKSLCEYNVLTNGAVDGVFTGAGMVALCTLYRLGLDRVVFHSGFQKTYNVGYPHTLHVESLGLMKCTGELLTNPDFGRQIAVLRKGSATIYMSGEQLPTETPQALEMKQVMEANDVSNTQAILAGPPELQEQLLRQLGFGVPRQMGSSCGN